MEHGKSVLMRLSCVCLVLVDVGLLRTWHQKGPAPCSFQPLPNPTLLPYDD